MTRALNEEDLEALALGAGFLGTGGGGSPYIGKLRTRAELRRGKAVDVVPLQDLDDDALVVSVGGIGAPVVGIEKFEKGDECLRALRLLEEATGSRASALISAEIGGANSMEPVLTAAQAGLPVVDADGMGRAFPEVQMTTFCIYGHPATPAAMADEKGNHVLFMETQDMYWLERLARATVVQMGAAAGLATAPMRGDFLKRYAVPGTVTQALDIGQTIRDARRDHRNVVQDLANRHGARQMFTGKVVGVQRELRGGFAMGHVMLQGLDDDGGRHAKIAIQNENLLLWIDDQVRVSVPDLIINLDLDNGEPITTELVRYGLRIAVLAMPAHPLMRTPRALDVVGPGAFGYPDVTHQPIEDT